MSGPFDPFRKFIALLGVFLPDGGARLWLVGPDVRGPATPAWGWRPGGGGRRHGAEHAVAEAQEQHLVSSGWLSWLVKPRCCVASSRLSWLRVFQEECSDQSGSDPGKTRTVADQTTQATGSDSPQCSVPTARCSAFL